MHTVKPDENTRFVPSQDANRNRPRKIKIFSKAAQLSKVVQFAPLFHSQATLKERHGGRCDVTKRGQLPQCNEFKHVFDY